MRKFHDIYALAADRQGGIDLLESRLQRPTSAMELHAVPDDRWLSMMTKCVFQAGFNWKVVESMWPGFEDAFNRFDIGRCAHLHDEDFDRLVSDTRIVRYGAKIKAVQENAVFISTEAENHGSFAEFITSWPSDKYFEMIAYLKKNGSRLGGNTGQYFLRFMGVDGYILSRDVIGRLIAEGIIEKPPTSAKAMKQIQEAFTLLQEQSGRSLTEISRVLAMSTG